MSPRVLLREPVPADRDALIELIRSSRAFLRGRASGPVTPAHFDRYLLACRRSDFAGRVICRIDDDQVVGAIELSQIALGPFRSAYLGYYIGAPYARQGFMSEALGLALRLAFTELKLHRVEANIQPQNVASIGLVRKLGFTREGYSRRYLKIGGRWRDHERWALLKEDWSGKRKSR